MTLNIATRRFLTQLQADGKPPLTVSVYGPELERFGRWLGPTSHVRRVRPDTLARYLTDPSLQVTPAGTKRNARTMNRTRTGARAASHAYVPSMNSRSRDARTTKVADLGPSLMLSHSR